jgi:hypothetical protein
MTLKDILNLAVKTETFNTCNDWGFGGGTGIQYTFANGVYIRKGSAHYRHTPSSPFIAVYKDGKRVIDESSLNKAKLLELAELIK